MIMIIQVKRSDNKDKHNDHNKLYHHNNDLIYCDNNDDSDDYSYNHHIMIIKFESMNILIIN